MFARTKTDDVAAGAAEALTLRSAAGKPMIDLSGETVAAMRRMLTSLMYQSSLPKSVACVSAVRQEGVSYITLAMAALLANDVNAKVCAVELNWWHPAMHLYLAGAPPAAQPGGKRKRGKEAPAAISVPPADHEGLGAVLRGTLPLADALVATQLPNLSVLPAGHVAPEARSALARSAQLKATIAELEQQFDYLMIDIPAVAATSDTVALTSLASAAVVVVRQGVTPVNTVKTALDEVRHVPVLGVILNQARVYTPRWILNLLPQE
jgi:Mrp family chromosome partitioning ATPase